MDEAEEIGEKIAEGAEKFEPMEEVSESAEETLDSMAEESIEAAEGANTEISIVSGEPLLPYSSVKYKKIDIFI